MAKYSRLTRISLLLAVLFLLDKLLGVARQIIISRQFGLSAELDVFNAANNLPDMLFMLISGGALAIAFIPVLSEVLTKDGRKKAWELFSNVLNITFTTTALLALLIGVLAKPLVSNQLGIAPGFTQEQIDLTVQLLRLNLVATTVFSISGLVMAALQANQHFLMPALAPIFYDMGQIFGALVLSPKTPYHLGSVTFPAFGFGVKGMVYGVIIGAFLHLLIQMPALVKYKFTWHPIMRINTPETKRVFRLMGPRLVSMLFIQLIFLFQDNLASRLSTGSVTALTYGWWIMQVPETLVGTAIATALFPTLAELFSLSEFDQLKTRIERAAKVMLALSIPIAVIMGVVLLPVVQILLGFNQADSMRVVEVTRFFLLGITGHSLVELFVRSFYAIQRPKFPLIGSLMTTVIFLVTGVLVVQRLGAVGIAMANTFAYTAQVILLFYLLNNVLPTRIMISNALIRGIFAAITGGLLAYISMRMIPDYYQGLFPAFIGSIIGILGACIVIRKDLRELTKL